MDLRFLHLSGPESRRATSNIVTISACPTKTAGDPTARGPEIDDIDLRAFISQGCQFKKHRRARDCNEASTKWFWQPFFVTFQLPARWYKFHYSDQQQGWMMINLSSSTHLASIRNIVIAGETGVGKSSLINLVTGVESATTANDVRGVTIGTECHYWVNDSQTFRLWDTPGLSEGSFGTVSPKQAQDALRSLLTELTRGDGVHLLVICMRGLPRVTKGMKHTYDTILRIRDKVNPNVPIVAIITDLEKRSSLPDILPSMDEWWTNNVAALREFNMAFSTHACITTLPDNCHPRMPGRRELCQGLVRHLIVEGVSPKIARNIIIAGEIGVGKSSVINLVLGLDRAFVANDVSPVTTTTSYYDWEAGGQTFRLWDTPGLGEGLHGSGLQKRAQEALRSLFMYLNERGGVHLLIICFRGISKIMTATKRTYDLVMKIRDKFSPATPVVAIITELEGRSTTFDTARSMEEWWATNAGVLSDYEMSFSGHACISTLPDDCHPQIPGRRELCRELTRNLIMNQSLHPRTVPPKDLHVLLFGETGVGKSSLINLLAGWQIASVSPDSAPCTLDSSEYQFQLGSTTIRLWDTVGLEEPERGPHGYVGAIEKAVQLIRRLSATGGISLFLFCIRGNRITATTQSNYRLFYEVLGKKEVPIALAVTHLEREPDMEDWWQRNGKTLERNGIHSAGHACITALEGHAKYAESRDIVQSLLSRFDHQGKFSMPSEAWIGRILKGLGSLVEKSFPRGKDLIRILTKRCCLDPDVAQRVAACIDAE
ncbi:P-loop containing nucleoside triphosphate hydrolase protein [Boletus edulis BED1]|uniref:P-loop containing nucleoside triphosphate hydrolase protein n=1 Tax=Boletus edulis BED1 TaxID=1328754 RepID=A0AAD4BWW9_BOLED|nr:P-loop containing nucleoside triphosphate hydrolase protein [Boletus edulis BED1]